MKDRRAQRLAYLVPTPYFLNCGFPVVEINSSWQLPDHSFLSMKMFSVLKKEARSLHKQYSIRNNWLDEWTKPTSMPPPSTLEGFAISHSLQSNNWTHLAVVLKLLGFKDHAPSGSTEERSLPGLSPGFWKFLGLWQHSSSLHVAFSLCMCMSLSKFPLFMGIPVMLSYGAHSTPLWIYLN